MSFFVCHFWQNQAKSNNKVLGRTYQPTVTARALIGSEIYILNYHHLDLIQFIQSYHSSKRTPKLAQFWTFYGRGNRSDGIHLVG